MLHPCRLGRLECPLVAAEPIVRLILDGAATRSQSDRDSLLVVIGVRQDGQKVLLVVKAMGGESTEAWRAILDDLIQRGPRRPEFLIVDGRAGARDRDRRRLGRRAGAALHGP
jgi:hypothetical protein